MRYGLSLAALATAFIFGCNKSPEGGSPGTSDSFTITGPSATMPTTIKQDNSETVKLTLNRGKDFKRNVKLTTSGAEGVKAELGKTEITPADPADVTMKVTVAKNAALGEHIIKVTGTPDGGSPTSVDVKIKVTTP